MTFASEVLADAPALWWRHQDTSGTFNAAADSSGNARHGTTTGMASTDYEKAGLVRTDGASRSFDYNGAGAYTTIPYAAWSDYTVTGVSVEAWINLDVVTGKTRTIMVRAVGGGQTYFQLNVLATGAVQFGIYAGGTPGTFTAASSAAGVIVAGVTYQIGATWNGATLLVYCNGVQVATAAKSGAMPAVAAPTLRAGSPDSTTTSSTDGRISEIMYWPNVVLPAARFLAHYDAGVGDYRLVSALWTEVLAEVSPANALTSALWLEAIGTQLPVEAAISAVWMEVFGTQKPVEAALSTAWVEVLGTAGEPPSTGLPNVARTGGLHIKDPVLGWKPVDALGFL
jgi:hypothetical protein